MRAAVRLLGGVFALVLVVGAVEVIHPKGVVGLIDEFASGRPKIGPARAGTAGPAAPAPAPAPAAPAETWGPGATNQLAWGDRDYDRGDFDGAVANYSAARVLAGNADERYRANQGLERALLGWGLVRGATKVSGKPADLETEYTRRLAPTEQLRDERAWLELVAWTAGAGLRDRLPYVCQQALDCAKPGGLVQARLDDALAGAGTKRDLLAAAMASRGLRQGAPLAAVGPGGSGASAGGSPASGIGSSSSAGSASGIGGVNDRGIPYGRFSAGTRERLRDAVRLQREGTTAYNAAGPDSPNRAENRHTAIRLLKEARDIYQIAIEEDSDSRDLDERLKQVMLMLAQLKKDEGVGR